MGVPPAVVVTMMLAFDRLPGRLGRRRGYLAGFLIYWLGWCLLLPLTVLGARQSITLFRLGTPTRREAVLLTLPPALGFGAALPHAVRGADSRIVLGSAAIAVVNGALEELLWRATYQSVFPESFVCGELYPSLGFAIWHYAPQQVFPNERPGGATSLVVVAGLLGLLWARVARTSGAHGGAALSHILFDFGGLGARIYFDASACTGPAQRSGQ